MARQLVDIGVEGNDGTGDSVRESFRKVNENFQELYAVFGIGGQISLTDLSDTPNTYEGNENKVPVVRANGSGIDFLELASDNALTGGVDTIGFDYSESGKLIIRQLVSKLSNDPAPVLSGPLNAASQPIANIVISRAAIDTFNAVYGTDLGIDSLVINKGYADRNYQTKEVPGGGIRLEDEPDSIDQYTLTADEETVNGTGTGDSVVSEGYLVITEHGLDSQFNGAPFVFNSTGTAPSPLTNGETYFIRIQDENRIALHSTEEDAVANTSRLLLSGGTGIFTIVDAAYNSDLAGNWLENQALPRKSIVRRQGDDMEGILNLSDHPGELSGFGLPNGPDDLQAVTKLYVDSIAATSRVNLYVSTSGDDNQTNTPVGLEGRNPSYAYASVNAAARKAEELIIASPFEPGPYVQTMTYNGGEADGTIEFAGINPTIAGRSNARTLILENKEFVAKEVTGFIDSEFPDFSYDRATCQRDVEYILDSVSLDALLGNNANYLSRWSGIRYYSSPSAQKAIGSQRQQTVAGIEYAKNLIENFILTNTPVSQTYQTRVEQYIEPLIVPDANAGNSIADKFDIVLDVIRDGVLDAPAIVDGTTNYRINIGNGNFGFIDQADPENTDIIPGKVVRGKDSGAIGRIIDYRIEAGDRPVSINETDEIEVQLLEPFEFIEGEELEYGNIVRNSQITIRVESGIYEEDYPIRIPANVSINGDEFRRSIIRPKDRVSQSRYANTFFYRDREFDGLVLGRSDIEEIGNFVNTGNNSTRAGGDSTVLTYTLTDQDYITTDLGQDAVFEVSVFGDGSVEIEVTDPGTNWQVGDIVTIPDSTIGNTGADEVRFEITKVPNGKEYVNPLSGEIDGYFGFHYLNNPDKLRNTGAGYQNVGDWETAALILVDNKEFIQEQVIQYMETEFPSIIGNYSVTKSSRDVGSIVDALIKDFRNGGNEFSLEAQGNFFTDSAGTLDPAARIAGFDHIFTIIESVFENTQPAIYDTTGGDLEYPQADLFNGSADPNNWQANNLYRVEDVIRFETGAGFEYYQANTEHTSGDTFNQTEIDLYWNLIPGPIETAENLIGTVTFGLKNPSEYNPPLRNDEMDVFLMNDATIIRNVSVQGHGGFMVVLDPEGQVLTKSPYIQTGSSFSRSQNKHVFAGGMFIDAFNGNSAVRVTEKVDGSAFRLSIASLGSQADPQGLFVRRPETPSAFYIDGRRFQVNAVTRYDPDNGTAEIILDPSSNDGAGFSGVTSQLSSGIDLDDLSDPIDITLQTAGNRSMLGNDFTQINDLGYGLVVTNGALSEMVSMFTYYCWTSYYAKNGAQIRSLTGSSCYGEYGLIAEGSDPNEIPDAIELGQDMVQPAKTFEADSILDLDSSVILEAGEEITQDATLATGIVSIGTGENGSYKIYLREVTGAFDTTNNLRITGPITGDSTVTDLNAIPTSVDSTGYSNPRESLSLHVFDMKDPPSNRSELDIYHPDREIFARYEIANAEILTIHLAKYQNINQDIPVTGTSSVTGTGAIFNLYKTVDDGYTVEIMSPGEDYSLGDTFVVSGERLGGVDGTHNAVIEVTDISSAGEVTEASATGTIFVDPATPKTDGKIYKLNFSTGDNQFSDSGLLETVEFGEFVNYRRNQTHILNDIARPDILTIRPSTAVIFDENPGIVYRTVSFLTSDSIGNDLPENSVQAGFDETYDYIRLIVDSSKAQETALSSTGDTKGATAGDVVIAVSPTVDPNEVFRLNNNSRTPEANRPIDWTQDSLASEAPIITWNGKKHYVFNYRGVDIDDNIVDIAEDNVYGIVDLADAGEDINIPATANGLAAPVVLGNELITLRAGLEAGATGDVTINISTCRATSHDFLDVGTGGFNTSNYPNVIFGLPREKDQAKEVEERTKGRVFYVSTDQDGIFRVGRFFAVDQGTGTVTFSASIALSDVDGLGFKRGVVITEFSTDSAMTDNATDTVPTESAIRGYVNRRLGYDVNGTPVANKLGPGVLAPNGAVPMTDDLNAAGNTVTNLKSPETDSDAATKRYVDESIQTKDTLSGLSDVEINDYTDSQLLVSTGFKKIFVELDDILNGPFEVGQVFTGNSSGAEGQIEDLFSTTVIGTPVIAIVYTPISDTIVEADVIRVTGGAEGPVLREPIDEWANGVPNSASDILVDTNREITIDNGQVTDRYTTLNFQYKPNSIVNSDVNASANISQSKLNLNAATTRTDNIGITQNDLGVAAFDESVFTTDTGFVSIEDGGLSLRKIERITDNTVLGNWSGDNQDGDIDAISFETVVDQGGGILDSDFTDTVLSTEDPGVALIRTGAGAYAISNVTNTGAVNSIVKTDADGSIQVNSLILGGDSSYEVLVLDTTELVFKTPAQGEILRAVGNTGTSGNTSPDVNIPGHLNIGSTGVAESTLQNQSNFGGESALAVDWIYSSFIEAPGEKGSASTGLAIGANTGKTTQGQVGIVVADTGTSSSVSPFIFSSTGAVPDLTEAYDIGSSTAKYATMYANLFSGTALEAFYADLAENYLGDADYEPGTVLIFGGDEEVTTTSVRDDHRAAGVVTTDPATLMNSHLEGEHVVGLALQGRVPCKIIGKVEKGDIIVTSAVPGYGMVNNNPKPGTVIGKALESKTTTDKGTIEVVVGKH